MWQDTRTDKLVDELSADGGQDRFREKVGLPLVTYFSGPKVRWILDNVDGARQKAEAGDLMFGNMDTWLIWNLTGGSDGGKHITDFTNASHTMLMTLSRCRGFGHRLDDRHAGVDAPGDPRVVRGLGRDPIGRQAAGRADRRRPRRPAGGDVRPACFDIGEAKNTYGTGNFMLLNTGEEAVQSKSGLLTTVCYKIGDRKPVYALEGSVAITGALVQWLRDSLKMIKAGPRSRSWPRRSTTTAGCTSCRRSRACSRRTGSPTPAGYSLA